MGKEKITQFVSFITDLELDEFVANWKIYARDGQAGRGPVLLQLSAGNGKYKYISEHECPEDDFHFAFKKGRHAEHFAEQKARIVQVGGYSPVQIEYDHPEQNGDLTIIAFVDHEDSDIDFYRQLTLYRHLNIYQAYYESCAYGYILEFCSSETNAPYLLQQIKTKAGGEAGVYKEYKA